MLKKLPQSSYPEHASEKAQIVFDLIDIYRGDANIPHDVALTREQVDDLLEYTKAEVLKLEGIFNRKK